MFTGNQKEVSGGLTVVDIRRFVDRFFVASADSGDITQVADLLLLDEEDYSDTDWREVFVDPDEQSLLN